MFDHGVDSMVVILQFSICCNIMAYGIFSNEPWYMLTLACTMYFLSNLTLVHTGKLPIGLFDIQELNIMLYTFFIVIGFSSVPVKSYVLQEYTFYEIIHKIPFI